MRPMRTNSGVGCFVSLAANSLTKDLKSVPYANMFLLQHLKAEVEVEVEGLPTRPAPQDFDC